MKYFFHSLCAFALSCQVGWADIQLPQHKTLQEFLNGGGQGARMIQLFRGYEQSKRDVIKHEFNHYLNYVAEKVNRACFHNQGGFRTKLSEFNQFRDRFSDTVQLGNHKDWIEELVDEIGRQFLHPIALSAAHHIDDGVFGGLSPQTLGTFKHRYSETVIRSIKECLSTSMPELDDDNASDDDSLSSSSASSSEAVVDPASYFIANIESEEPFRREHRIQRGDDFTGASIFDARFVWVSPSVFVPAKVECGDGRVCAIEDILPPSTMKIIDKKLKGVNGLLGSTQPIGFELIFDFKFGPSANISDIDIVKMLRNRPNITRICELKVTQNRAGVYVCKLTKKDLQ